MAPIYCATMSIKSDRWIRRMAHQHRMIEPFADDPARGGVISYGVSSYGYDMRVAPEFKIFTNALSAVVDPKHRSEEHTSELQSRQYLVCRLLLEKKKNTIKILE